MVRAGLSTGLALVVVVLAVIAAPIGCASPQVQTVEAPAPSASAAPPRGLQRASDYALRPSSEMARVTLFSRGTPYPTLAPDGETLLLSSGRTAMLRSRQHPRGVSLPGTDAYRSAFSPDGSRLVTSAESGDLAVWSVPSGKLELRLPHAFPEIGAVRTQPFTEKEVAFPTPDRVVYHDGCRLRSIDLSASRREPRVVGRELCGRALALDQGARWLVLEVIPRRRLGLWYERGHVLDASTGETRMVFDASREGWITDVQIAPKGDKIACLDDQHRLGVLSIEGGPIQWISETPVARWFAFDASSQKLLFADVPRPFAKDDAATVLELADFTAGTVRRVAALEPRMTHWYFGGSADVLVTVGYRGAVMYDSARGRSLRIFGERDEGQQFLAWPGEPRRFVVGKASGGATDLYEVVLPD